MCIDATWKASFRFFAGIGTMNRWTSRAGRKASMNRTHSKRFALAAESADDASAFGVRAASAPLSQGRLGFDSRAGSWKAPTTLMSCLGTLNPPLTPPGRGTDTARRNAGSPLGRGRGRNQIVLLLVLVLETKSSHRG